MQISIWEKESFYANRDVIIAGAGLAGLWTAYELKKNHPSLAVLILERGILPTGASTRNAGFACFGSPTELLHDSDLLGEEKMLQIAEMRYKGIEKIKQVFPGPVIDFDECGGYECLQGDVRSIKDKLPFLNKALQKITGVRETFIWANEKLSNFGLSGFDAMIENKAEASLHSGKLVQSLTRLVQNMGVDILTGIEVKACHYNNNLVEIETNSVAGYSQSLKFMASQFIICTNAFTSAIEPYLTITPARGQVIVTSEISDLKLQGTFHFDEGFYYFRNLGNRILLGGARNKSLEAEQSTDLTETDIVQQELESFLQQHIAGKYNYIIEYRWSGVMGFTSNKQPLIQKIGDNTHVLIACNGMGVALLPLMAENMVKTIYA